MLRELKTLKIKKPSPQQLCEACNKKVLLLYDARVKRTDKWPKDHWVYLCRECFLIYGIGDDEDNLILWEKSAGRFFEIRKVKDGDKDSDNL